MRRRPGPTTARGPSRWRWFRLRWRLRWRSLPALVRAVVYTALLVVIVAGVPFGWTRVAAAGHLHREADLRGAGGPAADVVLVLGAQVAPGGARPMPFLRGRLDTAAKLVRDGRAKVILVSGDAEGGSGNETEVMVTYLTHDLNVDPRRVVADPNARDTYDACLRAVSVYGVRRALVVTQPYHLSRAVTLCRHVGLDADGVGARCDGCRTETVVRNTVRDYFACSKAALDALLDRPPAVASSPSTAVTDALAVLPP